MEPIAKKINVVKYVKELLRKGVIPFKAEKKKCIKSREGIVGEEVITWSEKDGKPIIEKTAIVTLDSKTGKPGHVVTKIDEKGDVIFDAHGHNNTWIIDDSTFQRKYTPNPEMGEGIYKPAGGIQLFIEIPEDIIIEQWGEAMLIGRGGVINITNTEDMYGISKRDFEDTYKIIEEKEKTIGKTH